MSQYKYFASVYDRMMDNIPYESWKQYLLELFYRYNVSPGAAITELGCGTGRMTRLLSEDGFDMTGIDLSEEMLEIARKNGASKAVNNTQKYELKSGIKYLHQDMRELSLPDKQDAIISICDSMNYLLFVDDLYKTMSAVKSNLKPDGVFIFDLKTEYFFVNELDGEIFSEDMGDFAYIWRNQYSKVDHVHRYYLEFFVDGKVIREMHKQRAFSAQDIKSAAVKAGFSNAHAYDAFTFEKPRKKSARIYIVMKN